MRYVISILGIIISLTSSGQQSSSDNVSIENNKSTTSQIVTYNKRNRSLEIAKMILSNYLSDSLNKEKKIKTRQKEIRDSATLIKAVEPILFSKYGKKMILSEKPYQIHFIQNYWIMKGTLLGEKYENENVKVQGGTFKVIVNPNTGEIVYLGHGK